MPDFIPKKEREREKERTPLLCDSLSLVVKGRPWH